VSYAKGSAGAASHLTRAPTVCIVRHGGAAQAADDDGLPTEALARSRQPTTFA